MRVLLRRAPLISQAVPHVLVGNAGVYLDLSGKRKLLSGTRDVLNVHGSITDAMRIGWLAAEHGAPIAVGTNFGVRRSGELAAALP